MLRLDVLFCFENKELIIHFPDEKRALAYQKQNPEGRILSDRDKCDVYLPVPPKMRHIRATTSSSYGGFIFVFDNTKSATDWCKRSVLGFLVRETTTEVYIKREWTDSEFQEKLGLEKMKSHENNLDVPRPPRPLSGASDRFKDGPSPARDRRLDSH